MKRKRHTGEEIIKKLREAGGMLAAGRNVEEVCRALGVSAATYQRWISHCGGIKKNARLKRAVADLILHMLDRFTFAGRAYHFPSAISLSIALSKAVWKRASAGALDSPGAPSDTKDVAAVPTYDEGKGELGVATKTYLLNKALNGADVFYEIELPEVFWLAHAVGSVLGRAKYGNRLVVMQGCTIGNKGGVYPVLGDGVVMGANSTVLGGRIGSSVCIGAGCLAVGEEIPDAHVALGRTPNLKLLDKVSPLILKYFSYDYGKTVSGNFGGSQKLGPHGGTAWSATD
jgi:hypothetical protein